MADTSISDTNQAQPAGTSVFATVALDEPITRGSQSIDTVRLRRPKSGELRGLSMVDLVKLEVDALQKLLPRISDPMLTAQDVAELSPGDLFQLATEIAGFLLPKGMAPDSLAT
mgnify:CR=1 FL=1